MVYVDIVDFSYAAFGGLLLGIGTTINYAYRGKVTGMSGILFSIISLNKKEMPQKLTLVGGMLMISAIFFNLFGYNTIGLSPFGSKAEITQGLSYYGFAISGLLVGIGTKLANGCTSGHGLCGTARLSIRSIVSVIVFLLTAIMISTFKCYVSLGFISNEQLNPKIQIQNIISANLFMGIGILFPIISYFISRSIHKQNFEFSIFFKDNLIVFLVGIIFGVGLMTAGMTKRSKINAFLQINQNWDPSLLIVLFVGVMVNVVSFNYMIFVKTKSFLGKKLFNPKNGKVDRNLIFGSVLFGLGWGLGSLCPGPFIMLYSVFSIQIHIIWGFSCFFGMILANYFFSNKKQQIVIANADTTTRI